MFPKNNRAIVRNQNVDLQSIGIYSRSDIQHHIRRQQFHDFPTSMDTIQRPSIDQNLKNLLKPQDFVTYMFKITADTLKIKATTYILTVKSTVDKISHQ